MKKQSLYQLYSKRSPLGYQSICNGFSLYVYRPIEDDNFSSYRYDEYLITAFYVNGKLQDFRHNKVQCRNERPFIRKSGYRFYLDEIMRASLD